MDAPHDLPAAGPGAPTPPIALRDGGASATSHLSGTSVAVPSDVLTSLGAICATTVEGDGLAEASRDWWPQAMMWALDGEVAAKAAAVVSPTSAEEVSQVLAVCHEARIPVTAAAGRSGVCGASVPVHGGVVLDLCKLAGVVDVDDTSLVIDVLPGTFGDHLEHTLRADHGLTLGHWPQSVALSTVGGWLACRSAGQLSTRYGKIEDMVLGLDVALADGRRITTGGAPRAAVGPDLNQLFVGSEGTLGIITGARLRVHPAPTHERRAAYGFASFTAGLDAMRRIIQRGGTPAVLRLYDPTEADRTYHTGDRALLLVLDEGPRGVVDATMELVAEVCAEGHPEDVAHVAHWLEHRNDVAALEALISRGYVIDTMEVVGRWRDLPAIYDATLAALQGVHGIVAASAHQSHSYPDGGCLYFTFAAQVPAEDRDHCYREAWDAGTRAVLAAGGALSHHHGIGLNRSRFVAEALGPAFDVLTATKAALDPHGILNPGKLGFDVHPTWGPSGY
ncbi:MAG TPA: FAD-binding oxidoreductase [Acidimicrobiales bacterium]|nr:FAD-binding oxidoreductase [Acidimicrobiales bacterium]